MAHKIEQHELVHPIWNQQDGEPDKQYQLFLKFIQMPPFTRDLGRLARENDLKKAYTQQLQSRFKWRVRSIAKDNQIERVWEEECQQSANQMTMKLSTSMDKLIKKVERAIDNLDPDIFTPQEIIKVLSSYRQCISDIRAASDDRDSVETLRFVVKLPSRTANIQEEEREDESSD